MRRIKIFIDNTIIPADIYAGQKIAFIFLPAGRQTAQGREQVVHQASVENENGRVINVTSGRLKAGSTGLSPGIRLFFDVCSDNPTPTGSTITSPLRNSFRSVQIEQGST